MAEPARRDAPLDVRQREDDGVVLVSLRGELDLATAPQLVAELDPLRRLSSPRVLVDLRELEFCDSTGLRALMGVAGEVRAARGRIALVVGPGGVARLLAVTGAAEWFDIQPDPDSALVALGRRVS